MKAKTIKAIIRKKVNQWLASIENEELRDLIAKNVIVTGGCIASMLLKEQVSDFDIYFRSYDVAERVALYYVDRFEPKKETGTKCAMLVIREPERVKIVIKSAGIASEEGTSKPYEYFEASAEGAAGDYVEEIMENPEAITDQMEETENLALQADGPPKYLPVFLSTNAITLSDRIQLVLRFAGDPSKIHENYDFVHCMNYWTSWDEKLVLDPAALECLLTKELRYIGSKYPICSLIRVRKFVGRGWTINAGQIVKMVLQVGDLNLKDVKVLEDQLTGVDVAYFAEMLRKIKEKDPEKINTAYLIEIIDRLF